MMDDQFATILGLFIIIAIIVALIKGAVKTFQRNWVAALLLLILLFPLWVIWAFIEVFTDDINKAHAQPTSSNQSFNVTLVNQADGTTRRISHNPHGEYPEFIDARVVNEDQMSSQPALSMKPDMKECPFCAETVRRNAVICRYCNREI